MSTQPKNRYRLACSIDPTSRGFAFAIMEGPQDLVDWGVAESRIATRRRGERKLREIFAHYKPEVLVLEKPTGHGTRRSRHALKLMEVASNLAKARGMTVESYPQADVRDVFARFRARTKHEIAVTIAKWLPELEPKLPRKRKPWMTEDDRMNVFDAVAVCIAYYYFTE